MKIEWRIPEEWLPLRGRKTGVFTGRRTLGGGGFCKRENDFGALGGRPVDWDE